MHSLFLIAVALGVEPTELGFIIADLAGEFGKACLEQGAGVEFVVPAAAARSAAIVIPLDLAGLVAIMNAVLPEAASLVTTKPADGTPFLVVDADDEPAVVFVDAPAEEAPCA